MKTHWKKLRDSSDYLGAHDLYDSEGSKFDMNVTIRRVSKKNVKNTDGTDEPCMVAEMVNSKPIIINATNSKTIASLSKSAFVEDWAGLTITVYPERIRAFGEFVDAIRIRKVLPPQLPILNPESPKWAEAVKYCKEATDKAKAIQTTRKSYILSDEDAKKLMNL
jgi:hypothetical protein